MTFRLEDVTPDLAADLAKGAENLKDPKSHVATRTLMHQAATKLDDYQRLLEDAITELDSAASLKIGMMDSQSRADDVTRQIRATLVGLSSRMQQMLSAPPPPPPVQPPADSAVI